MTLSDQTIQYLSSLIYSPDAERRISWIPLGGIFWADEFPEDRSRFTQLGDVDKKQVLQLFAIRFRFWNGESLEKEDREFWDAAVATCPDCPVFKRLQLSLEEREAQQDVERSIEDEFADLFADADQVTITDEGHGVQSFSATFDLTKVKAPKRKWWWKRLLGRT